MKLKDLIKTALFVELMAGLIIILHGLVDLVIFAQGKVGFNAQLKTILDFS